MASRMFSEAVYVQHYIQEDYARHFFTYILMMIKLYQQNSLTAATYITNHAHRITHVGLVPRLDRIVRYSLAKLFDLSSESATVC